MEHVGAGRALQRRRVLRLSNAIIGTGRTALVRHAGAIACVLVATFTLAVTAGCSSAGNSSARSTAAAGVVRPNATLTPGDVLPATRGEICSSGYSKRVRDVSSQLKRDIYAAYGITSHQPGEYEVDHLIPLGVGGSNDKRNLWPEPINVKPGAKQKDDLENELHNRVCDGRIDLAQAQREIAADWYAAYLKYVPGR